MCGTNICAVLLGHANMFVQPLGRIYPFNLKFSNKITTNFFDKQSQRAAGCFSTLIHLHEWSLVNRGYPTDDLPQYIVYSSAH